MKYNPPWRKVLLRHLKPGQSLGSIYRLLGWDKSRRYWSSRDGGVDLRLSVASQMAMAVGVPLGPFLAELATATGIPALAIKVEEKPRETAARPKRKTPRQCSYCKMWTHVRKDCPTLHGLSEMQLMHARGEAFAASGERIRSRRKRWPTT